MISGILRGWPETKFTRSYEIFDYLRRVFTIEGASALDISYVDRSFIVLLIDRFCVKFFVSGLPSLFVPTWDYTMLSILT